MFSRNENLAPFQTSRGTFRKVAIAAGLVATMALTAVGTFQANDAAAISAGAGVVVDTDALNLRDSATVSGSVVSVMAISEYATVIDGPVSADGYTWYQLQTTDGSLGWADGEYLASDVARAVGTVVVVEVEGLNLRDAAGVDAGILAELPSGTYATILGSPEALDSYAWYQVETDYGTGWVVGDGIASGVEEVASLSIGSTVAVATDALNLRADASVDGDVTSILLTSETGTIIDGPIAADGYNWYQVETADGTIGWVVGDYLSVI